MLNAKSKHRYEISSVHDGSTTGSSDPSIDTDELPYWRYLDQYHWNMHMSSELIDARLNRWVLPMMQVNFSYPVTVLISNRALCQFETFIWPANP